MKHFLLPLFLLTFFGTQTYAMDNKENKDPLIEPLLIEPLENWAYEDLGLDGFLERIGEGAFFSLRKTSEEQKESLQVSIESLVEVDPKTCEAFAVKIQPTGDETIFQIRFKYRDVHIHASTPVRATVNDYSSIVHHKNIINPFTSHFMLRGLIAAVKEQKNNSSAGEIRKSNQH